MSIKEAHLKIQNSWKFILLKFILEQNNYFIDLESPKLGYKYELLFLYDAFKLQGNPWYQTVDFSFKIIIKVVPSIWGSPVKSYKPLNTPTLELNIYTISWCMFNFVVCGNYDKPYISCLNANIHESTNKLKSVICNLNFKAYTLT